MTPGSARTVATEQLMLLAQAADPGPWVVDQTDDDMCASAVFVGRGQYKRGRWPDPEQVIAITLLQSPNLALADLDRRNAKFIAAAREGVPWLCAQVEETTAQRDRLVDTLRRIVASAAAQEGASVRVAREPLDEARALLASIGNG